MVSVNIHEIIGNISSCDQREPFCSVNITREYGMGCFSAVVPMARDIFLIVQDFSLYGDEKIKLNTKETVAFPLLAFSFCLGGVYDLYYDHPRISMGEGFSDIVISDHRECLAMLIESNASVQTFDVCMKTSIFEELTGRNSTQIIAALRQLDCRANKKVQPIRSKELDIAQRICGQQIFATWLEQPKDILFLEAKSLEFVALQLKQLDFLMGNVPQQMSRLSYSKQILFAREILQDELNSPPTIFELSRRVGLNHNQLTKGFRDMFGQTPFEYLRTIRLERARTLITSGKRNVTEAAFEVGYTSLSHFSKNFHRAFGANPKALQKVSSFAQ